MEQSISEKIPFETFWQQIQSQKNRSLEENFQLQCEQKSQKQNVESEYCKEMQVVPCERQNLLKEKLKQGLIFYTKWFRVELQKTIQQKTGNFYVFSASIGHYQTTITVLKINMKESFIPRKKLASGCYASIFTQEFENQIYVIKSQKISEESIANFDKKFDEILQQYFIYKMASILEFGPKMKNLYGFDIVCFNDSLEFSMELCWMQQFYSKQISRRVESDLLAGMKIMHTLQIVHRDIKNKNIAWSPTFKKWVFLDFGFSSLIQQKPGEKTFTSYRGTYEYSSKQLKNLYHLKTYGFVDLYQNDLHGIKVIEMNSFQITLNISHNSNLFLIIIVLCRMKKQVVSKNFEGIEQLFLRYFEFRDQFLKLIIIQLERQKRVHNQTNCTLQTLYFRSRQILIKRNNKQNKTQGIEKERKKYFNLFIEENQSSKSMWIFLKESDLSENIQEKWGQFEFMKGLFIFFSESLFSNSKVAWKRMKLITDIIIEILIPNFEKRNWLWNFHYILQKFEEKFLEKKQFDHLKQIYYLYHFFNDRMGQKRLNQVLWENTNQGDEILQKMFCKLFQQMVNFRSIDTCKQFFQEIKERANQKEKRDKMELCTNLEQIAELMLNFMLFKKNEKQQHEKFCSLLSTLKKRSKSKFIDLIICLIQDWQHIFSRLFYNQGEDLSHLNLVAENKIASFDQYKYILLDDILRKISKQTNFFSRNLFQYFKSYPLLEEIPNKSTFVYYLMKQNAEKINQITENIIQFNKDCLELITSQLQYLHTRWDKKNLFSYFLKQKKSVLKFFLASFKNRLNHNQVESIEKFWEFYSMYFRIDENFFNDSELKGEIISSISYIIEFFNFQNLSASNKIYIHLFISLKIFLEGTIIATDEFLEQLEKKSLIEELEGNKKLLCDFIRIFPFYQISAGRQYLQETKLFDHILSTKMLYWLFYESPLFFSNVISARVIENKQYSAFDLIISHTKYLSINKLVSGKQYYIFVSFIKCYNKNKLEMILFFLSRGILSTFRQNSFLSCFVLMIYLFFESEILSQLKFLQIQRVYTLSAISINKFPFIQRINLRNKLNYKFRDIFNKLKLRKKRILNRQHDYSTGRYFLLKKEIFQKLEKKQVFFGKLKMNFEYHLKKLKKNIQQKSKQSENKFKAFDSLFD